MKKGSKPYLVIAIFIIISLVGLALVYVALKRECDWLVKAKFEASKKLDLQKNRSVSLKAQFQLLTAEERIVSIAESELGMIKNPGSIYTIIVEKNRINAINKKLSDTYGN